MLRKKASLVVNVDNKAEKGSLYERLKRKFRPRITRMFCLFQKTYAKICFEVKVMIVTEVVN
ncbi:MAG: hypothetical protein MUC29_14410, partial [Pyrinomonadaceae bacterium]|nr:hypothetical protein [Pyrinomonadaceae bacterium]